MYSNASPSIPQIVLIYKAEPHLLQEIVFFELLEVSNVSSRTVLQTGQFFWCLNQRLIILDIIVGILDW